MKIEKLLPYGYCAGVTRAISIAKKAKEEHPQDRVAVFGMLVHNNEVVEELKSEGIATIFSLDELNRDDVVILTAHGHSNSLYKECENKGLIIYDATCPKVERNINIIKKADEDNKQIIYIGFKSHNETKAAISYSSNVILYDMNEGMDVSLIQNKDTIVINQTTININNIKEVYKKVLELIPNAFIENEICNATRARQESIIKSSQDIDLFIIVGDKLSSNTNRLLEIAKSSHPKATSIMVSNLLDIDKTILKDKKYIAITGGASTPPSTIDAIFKSIV